MYYYPVHEHQLTRQFIKGLRPGECFNTYDVVPLIRGRAIVDKGIPGAISINASIGRGLKKFEFELGIALLESGVSMSVNGQSTQCSTWIKS